MRKHMQTFFFASVVLLLVVCVGRCSIVLSLSSRSISVGSNIENDYASIQEAIDAAEPGDIINVTAGVYYENLVINKSIAIFGENRENTIVDGDGKGHVAFIDADNVTLGGLTLRKSGTGRVNPFGGVVLNYSNNCLIANNAIIENEYGVWFSNSYNNTFVGNVVANSSSTYGIRLYESKYNVLIYNSITDNAYGIYLYASSDGNAVRHNNVSRSSFGIYLGLSHNNTVQGNNVVDSRMYGITLRLSGGNSVFHNNFLNNSFQTELSDAFDNFWDDGYPSGGNYWSDYGGVDEFCGPDQNVSGSDGFGDTKYGSIEGNLDRYPLMGVFGIYNFVWNGTSHSVFMICNASITGLVFSHSETGVEMHLNVSGVWETAGFCRISVPKSFLENGEYDVVVNGDSSLPVTQLDTNDKYAVLYIVYVHGPFIPELAPLFSALLFSCLTLVLLLKKFSTST